MDIVLCSQVGLRKGKKTFTFVYEHVLTDCSGTQEVVEVVVNGCQKLGLVSRRCTSVFTQCGSSHGPVSTFSPWKVP